MPPTVSHRLKTSSCFSASGIEASSLSITTRVRERKSKANSLDSSSSILKPDLVTCESISLISGCRKKFKRWIISLKIFKFSKFNDNTQFSRFWEFFSLKFYILTREEEIDSREKWKRVIVREFYSWRKSFLIIVNNPCDCGMNGQWISKVAPLCETWVCELNEFGRSSYKREIRCFEWVYHFLLRIY